MILDRRISLFLALPLSTLSQLAIRKEIERLACCEAGCCNSAMSASKTTIGRAYAICRSEWRRSVSCGFMRGDAFPIVVSLARDERWLVAGVPAYNGHRMDTNL